MQRKKESRWEARFIDFSLQNRLIRLLYLLWWRKLVSIRKHSECYQMIELLEAMVLTWKPSQLLIRLLYHYFKEMNKDDIIIFLVLLSIVWWAFANWFSMSVSTLEEQNDKLLQRVRDMEKINKQKCIELFIQ